MFHKRLIPFTFLSLILISSHSFSETIQTNQIQFGLGVDYYSACEQVDPNRGCDGSNMLPVEQNSLSPRDGSKRFITQSYSTNPFSSLYHYVISTGNAIRTGLIGINGQSILQATTSLTDLGASWNVIYSSLATANQKFSFVTIDPNVIMTGDALTDPVWKFNVLTTSLSTLFVQDATTITLNIRAKYVTNSRNYTLYANIRDIKDLPSSTTDYPSRVYYSLLLNPSSITVSRFEDVGIENGQITGMSNKLGRIEIYQPKNITEFTYTKLNIGGDQDLVPIVDGFGCIAPTTLDNVGIYDIGLSYEGIFLWDGGRRSRIEISQEKDIISKRIKLVIDDLIKTGKYKNAVGKFLPKDNEYLFCYEDSHKFPVGKNNSCVVFDFKVGEWYPINNWLVSSLESYNYYNDLGEVIYGDSNDGYVNVINKKGFDDVRKEISLDTMDSTVPWVGANNSTPTVVPIEGSGAVRLQHSPTVLFTSAAKVGILNVGEWYDKSRVTKDDKLQFKVYPSSIQNISAIRVDLLVEDVENAFTLNFSSVTLSTGALANGNTAWSTVEIALSSFPLNSDWTNLSIESFPFAGAFTYYGVRFVSTSTGFASLTFDDLRIIQKDQNPINPFWVTPSINLNNLAKKENRELILTRGKSSDSSIKIDIFLDYGQFAKTIEIEREVPKTIHLLGRNGVGGIYELDSNDFSVVYSSVLTNPVEVDITNGDSDIDFIYLKDRALDRLIKVARSSFTVYVATFGSLGTGTSNHDLIHQIALDDSSNLWLVDNGNNRIKVNRRSDLKFLKTYGELGLGATQYHSPTGMTADKLHYWVGDDGNSQVKKFLKDNNKLVSAFQLDMNTPGDISLRNDQEFLYVAYNKTNSDFVYFQDIILEKRLKSSGKLLNRIIVKPDNVTVNSTSSLRGDIALQGDNIYITFTDDSLSSNGRYYLQKRLKENFDLIKEVSFIGEHFGVIGYGLEFLPSVKMDKLPLKIDDSVSIQLRYYGEGLGNRFRLFSQAFSVNPKPYTEGN